MVDHPYSRKCTTKSCRSRFFPDRKKRNWIKTESDFTEYIKYSCKATTFLLHVSMISNIQLPFAMLEGDQPLMSYRIFLKLFHGRLLTAAVLSTAYLS